MPKFIRPSVRFGPPSVAIDRPRAEFVETRAHFSKPSRWLPFRSLLWSVSLAASLDRIFSLRAGLLLRRRHHECRVSGGLRMGEKTNRIVGRECASCCDAYQSWRYPSLHTGSTVSLVFRIMTQQRFFARSRPRFSLGVLCPRAASFDGICRAFRGFRRNGIFEAASRNSIKTYSSWRSVVVRREAGDDDSQIVNLGGRATPFSRWSVELPALIFAWEWRGPGRPSNPRDDTLSPVHVMPLFFPYLILEQSAS